ncbi:MAG: cytochrome C, partial [Deltaproteobacteria bacterium]
PETTCQKCHIGLEQVSQTHGGCVDCHGGDPRHEDKKASHAGMFGPRNPSAPQHWDKTCGRCHALQLERVKSNLMTTNVGMIRNIMLTWEGPQEPLFSADELATHAADGTALKLEGIDKLNHLSAELYRKFCSGCHVARESSQVYAAGHAAGCAACHFPFNEVASYEGGDKTVRGKTGYSKSHQMEKLPSNEVCARCHNRSGRIALAYEGLNDGNNGLVPSRDGLPGPRMISGARNVTRVSPDIHHQRGMECIDCHTSREVMGDGYAYRNMYLQTEVSCESCHGSGTAAPKTAPISRENEDALRESRSYQRPNLLGDNMVLTAKERRYSNVFVDQGKIFVQGKRDGKLHESKVVTGSPEHTIVGHERLACTSCHSRSVVQCYGCHTRYDQGKLGTDHILGRKTPGRFSETEDLRRLFPFPLAIDQRGEIAPVTPGCQTFVTVTGPRGEELASEVISRFKGKRQLRFAPFFGHSVGGRALTCRTCHAEPAFFGFGLNVTKMDGSIEPLISCELNPDNPLDGFLRLAKGQLNDFAAITREGARPLNATELKRVWQVNLCLACHDDPKD